jgi:hypothetical protein
LIFCVNGLTENGRDDRAEVIGRKTTRKSTTGKPRIRLLDNIKMDFLEVGSGCVD